MNPRPPPLPLAAVGYACLTASLALAIHLLVNAVAPCPSVMLSPMTGISMRWLSRLATAAISDVRPADRAVPYSAAGSWSGYWTP
jgi:hypothetical protein